MRKPLFAAITLSLCTFAAHAVDFAVGDVAPQVSVADKGELFVDGKDIIYKPWDSAQMVGKTRVLHVIAGRSKSKALNAPLMDAITAADFPADKYQTTTIVNQDDALFGTGNFVKNSLEDSKRENHWSSMVLDANGEVAGAWDLKAKSSFIAVQAANGEILWMKEGALTEAEVTEVIALVKQSL